MQRPHRRRSGTDSSGRVWPWSSLVAMIASTKFFTPEELAAALPKPFDPGDGRRRAVPEGGHRAGRRKAKPLGEVVAGRPDRPEGGRGEVPGGRPERVELGLPGHRHRDGDRGQRRVSLRLKVDGVPEQTPVIVPLGTAIKGTVVRDVMGFKFADAPGQTDYQYVGDELKKLMQAERSGGGRRPGVR